VDTVSKLKVKSEICFVCVSVNEYLYMNNM